MPDSGWLWRRVVIETAAFAGLIQFLIILFIGALRLRGFENVKAKWALVCVAHNLLKMYRAC